AAYAPIWRRDPLARYRIVAGIGKDRMLDAVGHLDPHDRGVEIVKETQQPFAPPGQRVMAEQATGRRLHSPDRHKSVQRGTEQLGVRANRQRILKSLAFADG